MKAHITNIEHTSEHQSTNKGTYFYDRRNTIVASGYDYDKGIEFTITMSIPAGSDLDIPDFKTPLNVSVSFDEIVSTVKTINII